MHKRDPSGRMPLSGVHRAARASHNNAYRLGLALRS